MRAAANEAIKREKGRKREENEKGPKREGPKRSAKTAGITKVGEAAS